MSSESILFDFADEATLLNKDNMVRLLIAVAEGDTFQFLKKAIVCDDSPGLNYVPNSPETLAGAWNNAIRARQRYNGYWMEFENASGLRLSFGFDPNEARRLFLSAKKTDLRSDDHLREFVHVGEIIFNTLNPFYGFGLFSKLQRYEIYYVVAAIWLFQTITSHIWLRYFRFGPFEWAWRSLTYLKKQPMKRWTLTAETEDMAEETTPAPALA